jgi:hypothetical protein
LDAADAALEREAEHCVSPVKLAGAGVLAGTIPAMGMRTHGLEAARARVVAHDRRLALARNAAHAMSNDRKRDGERGARGARGVGETRVR